MLQLGIKTAKELDMEVAISIVDSGGHLLGFIKTEQSGYATIDASLKKAKTAGAFGMATDKIGELVKAEPFMKNAFENFDSIFYFGGGLPVYNDGILIGGIGVSGVDPLQDKQIAETALMALE